MSHSHRNSMEGLTEEQIVKLRKIKSPIVRRKPSNSRRSQQELTKTQIAAEPQREKFEKLISDYENNVNKQLN